MFIMLQTYIKLCEYRNVKAKQLHNLRKSPAKRNYSAIYILNILLASRSRTLLLFSYPLRGILRKSKNINMTE